MCEKCGKSIAPDEMLARRRVSVGRMGGWGHQIRTYCLACAGVNDPWAERVVHLRQYCWVCRRKFLQVESFTGFCHTCCNACARKIHGRNRRERLARRRTRECEVCGETFTPPRSDAKTCSPACRQKAYRRRRALRIDAGAGRVTDAAGGGAHGDTRNASQAEGTLRIDAGVGADRADRRNAGDGQ